jgi:hypothetical protein
LLASRHPDVHPTPILTGRQLAPVLVDRVRVRILKEGDDSGSMVAPAHLNAMLGSEAFLQQFKAVDLVVKTPGYLPDFELVRPGYNDGGPGRRVLCVGPPARVERSPEPINAFLDVMDFAGNADRTNAVAALTVLLRSFWPGAKPALVVTSTKSHGGKDTVILFASGSVPSVSVSYQSSDWALERTFVGTLKHSPETGLVNVGNARLARGGKYVASAFLERFLTGPEPLLFSTGTGGPVRRANDVVLALSTNFGTVSEDLMSRALPIHLTPRGDVARRESPIGNPKLEYLPAHRERIEAELRGMVEKWKEAGRPLDTAVRHPFTEWARTVGGILLANGFADFLGNYSLRKTHDDPVRQALGLLGRPGRTRGCGRRSGPAGGAARPGRGAGGRGRPRPPLEPRDGPAAASPMGELARQALLRLALARWQAPRGGRGGRHPDVSDEDGRVRPAPEQPVRRASCSAPRGRRWRAGAAATG